VNTIKSRIRWVLTNRWFLRMIGVSVFVLILAKIDLGEALRVLTTLDPRFLIVSLALQASALVIATFRWQLIMRRLAIRIPFVRSLIYGLIGTAAALITPGQLGEFIKVLYLRNLGAPVPESVLSVLIDRAYDLLMLLLFGFIAVAILFGVPPTVTTVIIAGGGIVLAAGYYFAHKRKETAQWIAAALARISPQAYQETVQRDTQHLIQSLGELSPGFLAMCGVVSVGNYALLLLRIYAVALALHIVVPFWYFAMVVPLMRLVGLIPISISGIGTRDITTIYLFGQVGIPQEASLVFSVVGLLALQFQTLIGLLAWWRYPLQLKKKDTLPLERLPTETELVSTGERATS
jgi:uncharacterized protein (TIRG00374 family)